MMESRKLSSGLIWIGGVAMLVGAIDPMEGSVLILPGSGLFALGTYLSQNERRQVAYRLWVFVLVAIGVGALWGLSMVGGIGGTTGRSAWWGVLFLPYPIGWSLGIWGPGSPRWMLWAGIVVSTWFLAILAIALWKTWSFPEVDVPVSPSVALAAIGLLTIGGCIYRLRKPSAE